MSSRRAAASSLSVPCEGTAQSRWDLSPVPMRPQAEGWLFHAVKQRAVTAVRGQRASVLPWVTFQKIPRQDCGVEDKPRVEVVATSSSVGRPD